MRLATLCLVFFTSIGMLSSQNIIQEHFSEYRTNDDYTKIHVTGKMFEMASNMEVESETEQVEDVQELLSGIKSFSMILGPESAELAKGKYLDGIRKVRNSHEELMSVDDTQGSFTFFIQENDGMVSELVMVGAMKEQFMVASLSGSMDLKKLGKITKQIRQEGFGPMTKVVEHGGTQVNVFPNPATINDQVSIEIPENLQDGQITVYDLSGATVHRQSTQSDRATLSAEDLGLGQFFIEIEKDQVRVKKKLVVR